MQATSSTLDVQAWSLVNHNQHRQYLLVAVYTTQAYNSACCMQRVMGVGWAQGE